MKIIFIHPDLGIGGAERLIVDAAVGLQTLGHTVTIYTSYQKWIIRWRGQVEVDCFVVDQLSYWIPLLQWNGRRVFFYGHFPDQLLTGRETLMKRLYRLPFDYLEEWTTGKADYIVANSELTKQTFMKTFPSIKKKYQCYIPQFDLKLMMFRVIYQILEFKNLFIRKPGSYQSIDLRERKK